MSLRGRDRIRRARGSRAWAAAKSTLAPPRPGPRAHWTEALTLESARGTNAARPRAHPPALGRAKRPHESSLHACAAASGPVRSVGTSRTRGHASWPFCFRRRAPPPHRRRTEACRISALPRGRPHMLSAGGIDAAPGTAHWAILYYSKSALLAFFALFASLRARFAALSLGTCPRPAAPTAPSRRHVVASTDVRARARSAPEAVPLGPTGTRRRSAAPLRAHMRR